MKSNADRFIAAYNRIERSLESILYESSGTPFRHRSFPDTVHRAAQVSAVARRYEHDLREYGELRNAIVHGSTVPESVIAEPHLSVVQDIERIAEQLAAPEKVLPRFAKRVEYVYDSFAFKEALDLIAERGFTQIPVYSTGNQFRGLLTEAGIAKWLAKSYTSLRGDLIGVTVADVLAYEEPRYNYKFISPDMDVYQVREIFAANERRDRQKIKAVLITSSGLPQLPLMGIITPWDLVPLYDGK